MVGPVGKADQLERLDGHRLRPGAGDPGVVGGEHHVLDRGQRRHEVEVLEHEAHLARPDLRPFPFADIDHVTAVELEVGSRSVVQIGGVQQAEDVHQRALARSGRAHDRDHLAGLDRDVDAAKRLDDVALAQAVGLAKVAAFEQWHRSVSRGHRRLIHSGGR